MIRNDRGGSSSDDCETNRQRNPSIFIGIDDRTRSIAEHSHGDGVSRPKERGGEVGSSPFETILNYRLCIPVEIRQKFGDRKTDGPAKRLFHGTDASDFAYLDICSLHGYVLVIFRSFDAYLAKLFLP